jgi:uncharacterized protein YgbK (DUF1537 family)
MDSQSIDDLDRVAAAAVGTWKSGLKIALVGSYGLLGAWLRAWDRVTKSGILIAASSYQETTSIQVRNFASSVNGLVIHFNGDSDHLVATLVSALRDGTDVLITSVLPDKKISKPDVRIAGLMAQIVKEVLSASHPAGLVLMGGELASRVFRELAPASVDVLAEPWPATPIVRFNGGEHDGLHAVIQSGSQGQGSRLLDITGLLHTLVAMRPAFH